MTRIIDVADLAHSETFYEFEGHPHDAGVSFIVTCQQPAPHKQAAENQTLPRSARHVLLRIRQGGTQPQRDVDGLHRLLNHTHQMIVERLQVCLVSQGS